MIGLTKANCFYWGLAVSCILFLTGCGGNDQSSVWTTVAQDGLMVQRDLIATETEDSVIDHLYYGARNERVYIAARVYPTGRSLTVDDVSNAPLQYYGLGPMGLSREEPGTKDEVSAIEFDVTQSVILSSGLQRTINSETRKQPYGDLSLRTTINETTYEVERTSGFPFFGEEYVEQLGDGKIRLELTGPDGVLFSIEDQYIENSSEF
jgi:hypothetical protein